MRPLTPGDRFVPWLNELPSPWECQPIKYSVSINPEALPESTPARYEFRYIDISSVGSTGRVEPSEPMAFDDAPTRARRIVRAGDTIVSTVRTYLKAIAYIEDDDQDLICSTGFAVLRPRPSLWPKFLFYWVRSTLFVDEICARSVGVSYPAINAWEIGSLPCPVLPFAEQQAIAAYLDDAMQKVDAMLDEACNLVHPVTANGGLMAQYRDALIGAAVTGRIDVGEGGA
ncbi:MAG: restriction endonuclease subunit S [Armatimonadetes bacterium]|nr:restriction endonuclease subunit S [Armatimonadota bacterium]